MYKTFFQHFSGIKLKRTPVKPNWRIEWGERTDELTDEWMDGRSSSSLLLLISPLRRVVCRLRDVHTNKAKVNEHVRIALDFSDPELAINLYEHNI